MKPGGTYMALRKIDKTSRVEKFARILDYLRWNTDKNHPTTQEKMRWDERYPEMDEYMGDKQTFNRLIKDMAKYYNTEDDDFKDEQDWRIHFKDWKKMYDAGEGLQYADEDSRELISMRISDLYYSGPFSYDELDMIIEGIWSNNSLDSEKAEELSRRIYKNLGSRFYKYKSGNLRKIKEPLICDKQLLRNNLDVISKAIEQNVQIEFIFNGYTHKKKLDSGGDSVSKVSPYYIVLSNGKYYLLCCFDTPMKGSDKYKMYTYRIDLMTEVKFSGADERLGTIGDARIPMRLVEGLPQKWDDNYILSHMNMSYDEPQWIDLRIKSEKVNGNPEVRKVPDYAFMHDWFGDNFRFLRVDDNDPDYDIVRVLCSPYGMVNWALQYSDRVEVLEPEIVRDEVIDKIKKLNQKYGIKMLN